MIILYFAAPRVHPLRLSVPCKSLGDVLRMLEVTGATKLAIREFDDGEHVAVHDYAVHGGRDFAVPPNSVVMRKDGADIEEAFDPYEHYYRSFDDIPYLPETLNNTQDEKNHKTGRKKRKNKGGGRAKYIFFRSNEQSNAIPSTGDAKQTRARAHDNRK